MNKLWKAVALLAVAAVGLAAGTTASAGWGHWPPLKTTTTTATTTDSTTTIDSTTVDTTATEATSTVASSPASVTINSPLNYTATLRFKSEILTAGLFDAAPGVTCVIDWGDGSRQAIAPAQTASGGYSCATSHWWTQTGAYVVTVTDVDANGPAASRSIYLYVVG
jgi:hypothetical protein